MAIVNRRICDVTGNPIGVKSYHLMLEEVTLTGVNDPDAAIKTVEVITDRVIDLSPRGIKRLQKFVDTGLSPMKKIKRVKPEDEAAE